MIGCALKGKPYLVLRRPKLKPAPILRIHPLSEQVSLYLARDLYEVLTVVHSDICQQPSFPSLKSLMYR